MALLGNVSNRSSCSLVHQPRPVPPRQVDAINDLIFQCRIQLQSSACSCVMQPDFGPPHICASTPTECTEKFQFTCFSFSPFPDLCIIQKTIPMGKTLALKQEAGGRKKETQHLPLPSSPFTLGRNRSPGAAVEL